MKIGAIQITERLHRKIVEAALISDLPDHELQRADRLYKSYRVQAPKLRGATIPQSDDWNWSTKRNSVEPGRLRFFGIRYEGELQGIMLLRLDPVLSRRIGSQGEEVLYVEYIESAPWNQAAYAGVDARFGAIGIQLLRTAAQASVEAGYNGRIALHSLPQSEGFYHPHCLDLGVDEEYDMRYFELDDQRAEALLRGASNERS